MTKLETGSKYNIPLMNSLVLYVGVKAINLMHSNRHTPTQTTIAQGAHMDIFQNLAVDLDNEGEFFIIIFIEVLSLGFFLLVKLEHLNFLEFIESEQSSKYK